MKTTIPAAMFSNIDENQLIDIVASVNNSLQEDF